MHFFFFFSSRRRHTRLQGDSSDVCSSDLGVIDDLPRDPILLAETRAEKLDFGEEGPALATRQTLKLYDRRPSDERSRVVMNHGRPPLLSSSSRASVGAIA